MIILYDRFSVAPDSLLVNNLKNKHTIVEDHYCENVILKIILNTELSFFFLQKLHTKIIVFASYHGYSVSTALR